MVYVAYMNNRGWPIYNRELGFVNITDKGKKPRQKIGGLIGWTWEDPMSVRFQWSYLTKEMFFSYFGKMFCSNQITTSASWRKKPCLPLALPNPAIEKNTRHVPTHTRQPSSLPNKSLATHAFCCHLQPLVLLLFQLVIGLWFWQFWLVTLLANIAFLLIS